MEAEATAVQPTDAAPVRLEIDDLGRLVDLLLEQGYEVIGPQVREGVIGPDSLDSIERLPIGWADEQGGGRYRLVRRTDQARFGYAVGPRSWKEFLHPARTPVWTMARRAGGELDVHMHVPDPPLRAFFGVRPCELAAILKQDRVLLDGPHPDPAYASNRDAALLVVVNCGEPAETCFCTSMGTGPESGPGYDIAITEVVAETEPFYIARAGTERGEAILDALGPASATSADVRGAERVVEQAAERIDRRLDTNGIRDVLYDSLESERWDDIANRCLACGNCTLACPTCFCTDLVDVTDLAGDTTDRWRVWDSCFSLEFSHLGPGPHRSSIASRYRQWLTHKLATWIDQYDESGCVGCGRCITWCPVGIDLTEELPRFREQLAGR